MKTPTARVRWLALLAPAVALPALWRQGRGSDSPASFAGRSFARHPPVNPERNGRERHTVRAGPLGVQRDGPA